MDFSISLYKKVLKAHYSNIWGRDFKERLWEMGPMAELSNDFSILEFPPNATRHMWVYATCGMSTLLDVHPIEVHIFSSVSDTGILELLTAVSYYHKVDHNLNLGHTVNFGRSWQGISICKYGLISLPYLDGPDLEILTTELKKVPKTIFCYWLIPITKSELEFKKQYGIEALEEKLESSQFNYLDPDRGSVT